MRPITGILVALTALLASTVLAVTPLEVKGSDFVNSVDGTRFQILGVAYQPGGSSGFNPGSGVDPLSNASVCLRDATLMQRLGVNTLRVYNLDPDIDHSACASIFNAAGIYLVLDVNSPLPNESLDRTAPESSYSKDYVERVFQVVASFMHFPNTLGFFSGNEVINEDSVSSVPAYLRAITRDIKDFIAKQAPRSIPVGYSAADVRPLLSGTFNYLSCALSNETSSSSKIDFFGLNSYSWCGDASYQSSGYDVLVDEFSNTTIPIFFSEYGCNRVTPRVFSEVPTLYGSDMSKVFSGGLVYEYSQEPNDYGLVNISSNGDVALRTDYENLREQYNSLDLELLVSQNDTATSLTAPSCKGIEVLDDASFDIPTRPDGVDDLISSGVPGNFPTAVSSVTNTKPSQAFTGADGQTITGLELKVLPDDSSNLPGNNTSGTSEPATTTTTTSSTTSSTASSETSNAAHRLDILGLGNVAAGALTLGLLMQL
ncbi:hypothetical protein DV738_g4278, partial [Chaetothyriales sp. CBS 135597]